MPRQKKGKLMNTPYPCDRCIHCEFDLLDKDNPNSSAWCELDYCGIDYSLFKWGDRDCPSFKEDRD